MRRSALCLVLFLLTTARSSFAQTASYRISGTVVSETNGQPIQRASVHILSETDRKQVQSTTSDEYGRFAFTGVLAGNFVLQGNAPGYMLTSYDGHDTFTTGIVTGAGVDTESLALKLRPQGALSGTILDESAEPVKRATVRLVRQEHSLGDSRTVSAGNSSTDDLGRFEFPRLAPGTYILAVTATPWYAVHPQPGIQEQHAIFGVADSVDPSLDVAYPTTYYPGVTDPSQASPIVIGAGLKETNLRLTPVSALSITFPYTPPQIGPNGQPLTPMPELPQLRISIFGQVQPVNSPMQAGKFPNQMEISGLAPGDYFLSDSRQPINQANGGTPLHLTESIANGTLPATPESAHLHVLLKSADGSAIPNGILVGLMRPHSFDFIARANSAKGEAKFDIAPGDYYFSLCGGSRRCFIRQILAGDQPLPSNNIHISSARDVNVTVTFAIGTHTIKGFVQRDGKPMPGAFLLLFPAEELGDIRTFIPCQSDLDGSFEFKDLTPGSYGILSIDGGWDLDWQKESVLARYLPGAVTIKVTDVPASAQILTAPILVQHK
jgi:hypothetical protein